MKRKAKILLALAVILAAAVYYYVTLPAINIHSTGFWIFFIVLVALLLAAYAAKKKIRTVSEVKESRVMKVGAGILLLIVLVYGAGALLS